MWTSCKDLTVAYIGTLSRTYWLDWVDNTVCIIGIIVSAGILEKRGPLGSGNCLPCHLISLVNFGVFLCSKYIFVEYIFEEKRPNKISENNYYIPFKNNPLYGIVFQWKWIEDTIYIYRTCGNFSLWSSFTCLVGMNISKAIITLVMVNLPKPVE